VVTKSKFKFVSGSLCLDFVNTVGGRAGNSILRDKFAGFGDVLDWSRAAGVLSAAETAELARRSAAGGKFLKRALALREAIYRIASSLLDGHAPSADDLALLNREIAAAATQRRLAFVHGALVRTWDGANPLDRTLWSVADSASTLFTSPDAAAIRQCPGDECGWLFLDTSRNHSRRWCEMRICGNRAKVRRFRENA
jgi:predicted RNA-binding Zn ribbon-like protein